MKQLIGFSLLTVVFMFFMGCSDNGNNLIGYASPDQTQMNAAQQIPQLSEGSGFNFSAVFQPMGYVGELPNSPKYGESFFNYQEDLLALEYSFMIFDLEIVKHAYIYYAVSDGSLVPTAKLFPVTNDIGSNTVQGQITNDDLMGPLAEEGLDALLDAMASGYTYVIVNTGDHAPGELGGIILPLN